MPQTTLLTINDSLIINWLMISSARYTETPPRLELRMQGGETEVLQGKEATRVYHQLRGLAEPLQEPSLGGNAAEPEDNTRDFGSRLNLG